MLTSPMSFNKTGVLLALQYANYNIYILNFRRFETSFLKKGHVQCDLCVHVRRYNTLRSPTMLYIGRFNHGQDGVTIARCCATGLEDEGNNTLGWHISSPKNVRLRPGNNDMKRIYPSASLVNVAHRERGEVIFCADRNLNQ